MENQLLRTFGRIHGKRLSARQQALVDNLLPNLTPGTDGMGIPRLGGVAQSAGAGILEIGFGAGEHVMQLAQKNPDTIVIGAEPFINGVASLLSRITTEDNLVRPEYKNIRIWADDVRKFLSQNPAFRFAEIWILHPDPWPKARHEKRRLLSAEFLKLLSGYLMPGGKIIIGTDHMNYYDWIIDQVKNTELKSVPCPMDIIETRYQKKDMFGANTTKYIALTP